MGETREGIPYTAIPDMCRRYGGYIAVDPLSRWGQARLWKASKRAQAKGLVKIERKAIDLAFVYPLDTPKAGA